MNRFSMLLALGLLMAISGVISWLTSVFWPIVLASILLGVTAGRRS